MEIEEKDKLEKMDEDIEIPLDFSQKRRSSSPLTPYPAGFPPGVLPPGFPFHFINPTGGNMGFPVFNPFLQFPALQLPALLHTILNQSQAAIHSPLNQSFHSQSNPPFQSTPISIPTSSPSHSPSANLLSVLNIPSATSITPVSRNQKPPEDPGIKISNTEPISQPQPNFNLGSYATFREEMLKQLAETNSKPSTFSRLNSTLSRSGSTFSRSSSLLSENSDSRDSSENDISMLSRDESMLSTSGNSSGSMLHAEVKEKAYQERRRKNNLAAKRSRDARRAKEDEISIRAAFLGIIFIKKKNLFLGVMDGSENA
ncbi:protein giant [Eurytemora carolleeae]|uniref:protein giant n=1 Tax=Eurytemora carolleeae TaxID=1294199 RepID=UPI000C792902|nr:protein giant [Eurytemora carolleeae]|eukprot:XP_023338525.1 protein giant-like [Eurytemora affinis]